MNNITIANTINAFKQLFRFAFVGIALNIIGYSVYLLITHLGVEPKLTVSILYPQAVLLGFYGHRNFAFAHKGSVTNSGVRFLIAHLFGYGINLLLLYMFVDLLSYNHQIVQAFTILLLTGYFFIVYKYFVFSKNKYV